MDERLNRKDFRVFTNADIIRNMTDEGLAAILSAFCDVSECRAEDGAVCPFYESCPQDSLPATWVSWLKQPYEEE